MGLFGIIFNFCTDYLEGKTAKNGQIQLILFLLLCVVRMIHAAIMVSDAAPNVAFRSCKSLLLLDTHTYTHAGTDMHSVIFEFPWQFGIAALACYMFGVAHTLSDVSPNCATSICISQQSHHLKCSIFIPSKFSKCIITEQQSDLRSLDQDTKAGRWYLRPSHHNTLHIEQYMLNCCRRVCTSRQQ